MRPSTKATKVLTARLRALFADLDVADLEPVASGYASEVFRSDRGHIVRVGKHPLAVDSYRLEQALLPGIASDLPVQVPVVTHLAPPSEAFPFSVAVHREIKGAPASPEAMSETVAEGLGQFLAALHRVPPGRAATLGVRVLEAWQDALAWARVCDPAIEDARVREALREWLVGVAEGTRFAAQQAAALTLCHFDAWCENLLLRDGRLVGVLDFGDACLAEPAAEWAALAYYPREFALATIEAYQEAGGAWPHDGFKRARDYLVYRELRGLHGALTGQPEEVEEYRGKVAFALLAYDAASQT